MFLQQVLFLIILSTSAAKFLPGQCHSRRSCQNGGICYAGSQMNVHWCSCPEGFTGSRCEDVACPDICHNGGKCVRNSQIGEYADFSCNCTIGFHGRYCEQSVQNSVCKRESPCGKHGRCRLTTSLQDYECSCHKGWMGPNCSERDPCPVDHCKNGGTCRLTGSTVSCDCPANFRGDQCQLDVNECTKNPCIHGTCVNEHGSFHCLCDRGYIGERCELPRETMECSLPGRGSATCRNGGVCLEKNNVYSCRCPPMYQGSLCEHDVDECAVQAPCQNGGTCVNRDGGFTCICPNGFEGETCERDRDECAGNPCSLGATCIDGIAMYTCQCPPGRTGVRCELVDRCVAQRPCNNGHCITDITTGDFTCECDKGFQGVHCDEDVNECKTNDNLCYNNGTCVNTPGGYHCDCQKPFNGKRCDQLMSSCDPNPCLNHGTCIDHIESFVCVCKAGFSGPHCEVHGVTCPEEQCLNGGICDNDVCICPSGFTGMFCEEQGVPCGMQTCPISNICDRSGNAPACVCPSGYYGIGCQQRLSKVVDCAANPCLHGTCTDLRNGYHCTCPSGYDGINCENPVSHCNSSTCSNGGICLHDVDGFICHCRPPFYGLTCDQESDPCANNNCGVNAICKPTSDYSNHTCECKDGYQGKSCDQDVDECAVSSPCLHQGKCENTFGSFQCRCPPHYTGQKCETKVDFCALNPCANNGTCMDNASGFICLCPPGFSGRTCQSDIDDCLENPCVNGAVCVDGVDSYRCQCAAGFSGRHCQINVDDCKPKGLCLNGGSCVDAVNSYECHCTRGYTGTNCQTFVDIDQYNNTDKLERDQCGSRDCDSKAGDGVCDLECNFFTCGYDGGDCSARAQPYSKCPVASYCARVFRDYKCDEICNNEACLFDGFDCDQPTTSCPAKEYCQQHYGDGHCDQRCNSLGCGFDGGDCERTEEETLSGDVVIVVLTPPGEFVRRVNQFLMTLSSKLRASIRIRTDSEGPMVFRWHDGVTGDRLPLSNDQVLAVSYGGVMRSRRDTVNRGVVVWVTVDVSSCRGDCFSDVGTVASYLGRAQAKQDLSDLGMPIYEAIARRPSSPQNPNSSPFMAILLTGVGMMMIVGCIYVLQQQQRTRKRRMITAPAWIPPTEAQNKQFLHQQTDHALRLSLYGSHGDIYSSCKRTKLDAPAVNYYHPDGFDGIAAPVLKPNVVTLKPVAPKSHPDPADVHFQAASNEAIKTPIDPLQVNARAGANGRTPLIWLADNSSKSIDIVLEDVQRLYNAGAHINIQDDEEETALFIACRSGRTALAKKLLELGADPCLMNNKNSTCLHQAAHNGDSDMVEELLSHKAVRNEINEVDIFDRTALMVSAMDDILSTRVADALLRAGADASFPGDKSSLTYKGRTALHYAAQYSNIRMLKYLIAQGANRDAQDLEDCTPLFIAAKEGRLEAVVTLVEAGASTEITDQKERTPREVAEDQHFMDIVEALTPKGESVVPLPMSMGKNIGKPSKPASKNVKRVPVKRKPVQPLTPPHSDGISTPSPSDNFQLGRPLLCQQGGQSSLLDSPGSDPTISHRDKYSPQGAHILSTPGFWNANSGTYMKPSPPYEEQHSELGLGGVSYYSNQGNPFASSFDLSSFHSNDASSTTTPNIFPPCQYTQQFHQV